MSTAATLDRPAADALAPRDPTLSDLTLRDLTLRDEERQPCEVWTRVMGYHRPVSAFNPGKKGEFQERRCFAERHAPRG